MVDKDCMVGSGTTLSNGDDISFDSLKDEITCNVELVPLEFITDKGKYLISLYFIFLRDTRLDFKVDLFSADS